MTRQERIAERNKQIIADFDRLKNAKKNGVRLYTYAYIHTELEKKYFLGTETIEKIILKSKKNPKSK